jgi:hypothetical protein
MKPWACLVLSSNAFKMLSASDFLLLPTTSSTMLWAKERLKLGYQYMAGGSTLVFPFSLDISSLACFVCHNRLNYLGYKYVPSSIVKVLSHDQSTNPTFSLQFTFSSVISPFSFSASSFELIKDASHSSDLICW